jgi:hypothetical protein
MPANYVLLETVTVGAAGAASVVFNNIPQTGYTDLVIKASARSSLSAAVFPIYLEFNSVTPTRSYKILQGNGSSAVSSGTTGGMWAGYYPAATSTANSFSNLEMYVPNYTSSNYKSVSVDGVQEDNATGAYTNLAAFLWSSTNAITSIQVYDSGGGSFVQYSTFSLYGIAAVGTTPVIAPKATGGDIIQTDGTYWYHAFLSSGTFTPALPLSCDVLTIAGGGGGGGNGGGGAGGLLYSTSQSYSTNQTITIGAGGTGNPMPANTGGSKGSNSVIGSLTAFGGGTGDAGGVTQAMKDGGSGGGGGYVSSAGTGVSGQGFAGGTGGGSTFPYAGGGGGGAGAVGGNGSGSVAGNGGAGTNAYSSWATATSTGVSGYYAGGGGGACEGTSTSGSGGAGGGGAAGASGTSTSGSAGTANTGSGGGSIHVQSGSPTITGGNGGSGIVIIRYPIA